MTIQSNQTAKSILFVDSNVGDYQSLIDGVRSGTKVVVLNPNQDGIEQITDTLSQCSNVEDVHILSHGNQAEIYIGNSTLGQSNLDKYQSAFQNWTEALVKSANILIYGCNVAKGELGRHFVKQLSLLTGADIAASNNPVGNSELGGDWLLNVQVGDINTSLPFNKLATNAYQGILAASDVINFNTGSGGHDIYVRPGGYSNTWTYSTGQFYFPNSVWTNETIKNISFSNVDFNPVGVGAEDLILTIGNLQYSSDNGNNWATYTNSYTTNFISVSGKIWRFADNNSGVGTITEQRTGSHYNTLSSTSSISATVWAKRDTAPTDITSDANILFSGISQGNIIAELTPTDTGLTTGGVWQIDTQSDPNLLTISSSSGNKAHLTIDSGTTLSVGQTVTVTAHYYDQFQTDSNGDPVGGQGVSKQLTFTVLDAQSKDLTDFGNDIKISTTTANDQKNSDVTTLSNGNYVTVWQSDGQDGETSGYWGVYAQIQDASGNAVGNEFIISDNHVVDENIPVVSALDNERFVVSYIRWPDPGDRDIAYRIIESNGAIGNELIANTVTAGDQIYPSITTLTDGSFLISWETSSEIHLQKINAADGSKNGSEVTIRTGSDDHTPSIAALSNGEYVVSWVDNTIYNTYAVVSTDLATIIPVTTSNLAALPRVAGLTGGGFVVAWESYEAVNYGYSDIYFQRYDNTGVAQGSVTQANNTTSVAGEYRGDISISELSGGGFVIGWTSPVGDYDLNGLFGRRFTSAGVAVDSTDFEINQYREGNQNSLEITALASDYFATTWTDNTSDTTSAGIEGRVLLSSNTAPTVTGTGTDITITEDTESNVNLSAVTFADAEDDTLTVTLTASAGIFSTPVDGSGVGSGVTESLVDSTHITLFGTVTDINTYLDTASNIKYTGASNASGNAAATITLSASDGTAPLAANPSVNVNITAVNDAPTVGGATAVTNINDTATATPFSTFTIGDVDSPAQTQTVSVTLDTQAKGSFTTTNGFTDNSDGSYSFSGTAAAAQTAIRGLVFTPAVDRVATGSTETTTFTVSVNDGVATAVTDATTVVSTSMNDAPVLGGTLGTTWTEGTNTGAAVYSGSSVLLFSSATLNDPNTTTAFEGATLTISLPSYQAGELISIPASYGNVTYSTGNISVSGTQVGTAANGYIADLVITFNASATKASIEEVMNAITYTMYGNDNPTAGNRTVTATFDDKANANTATGALTGTLTGTLTTVATNDVPVLGGTFTTAGAINDTTTTTPFSGVTVSDMEFDAVSIGITYTAANGTLTGTGITGTAGNYTLTSAALATVQANLQGLTFTPTANQAAVGSTVTTTFTLTPNDSTANGAVNATTVVTTTPVNDAPGIAGAVASQAVNDNATNAPFSVLTITDADSTQTQTVTVTLDTQAKGSFTTLNGFADNSNGSYSFSGTASAAQTAIRGLVFTPTADRVAIGSTETTTFTVSVNDGVAAAATNNTTTVVSTSMNDAPTVSNVSAGQAVNDNATISPFSATTLADAENDNVSLTVTLDTQAKGSFITLSGFTDNADGSYSFASNTLANAQTALQGLVFTPTADRVAVGSTETTTFTLVVNDGTTPTSNSTTTVVSTAINDAPGIGGAVASQAVNDNATNTPFSALTITDADSTQTQTVTVTLDTQAKGSFTTLNGFTDNADGSYSFSGTASAAQTAIRGLVFTPTADNVAVGSTETTTFTVSVNDGVATAVTDAVTTVVSTAINDAPGIAGAVASQAINDNATNSPFSALTITDADSTQTQTVTVTLDTQAKGLFTTLNGFTDNSDGSYSFSGTASAAQTAIRGLVFTPTADRVAIGSTETTTFTVSVNDGVAAAATDNTTTVVSTSVNDAPAITSNSGGATAAISLVENQTAVTTITTTDAENDTVTYALTNGADQALFNLDANTGVLTFLAAPSFTNPTDAGSNNVYDVQVTATDDGVGTPSDVQDIAITITPTPPAPAPAPPPAPAPAPDPEVTTETVDGVTVETETVENANGTITTTVTIEPVIANRDEDSSSANILLADIPLQYGDTEKSTAQTTVSLPVGVGLVSVGDNTPSSSSDALDQLIALTNSTVSESDNGKGNMLNGAQEFLDDIANGSDGLVVNTLLLTVAEGVTQVPQPIVITGTPADHNTGVREALVIDASNLPPGTQLDLSDVEFAVIIGPVTLRGGEGANIVYAGAGNQNIVLGADDDELHGGDGDDTIGSEGGNDFLFGDAGDDILFGGEGHDLLLGGIGSDIVTYNLDQSAYKIEKNGEIFTVRNLSDSLDADTLLGIEAIQFADTTLQLNELPDNILNTQLIAGLYVAIYNRAPDVDGLNFWNNQLESQNTSLRDIASGFSAHSEFDNIYASSDSASQFVDQIYLNILGIEGDVEGRAYWTSKIESGLSRTDFLADFSTAALKFDEKSSIVTGIELANATQAHNMIHNKVDIAIQFSDILGEQSNGGVDSTIYLQSIDVLKDIDDTVISMEDPLVEIEIIGVTTGVGSAVAAEDSIA